MRKKLTLTIVGVIAFIVTFMFINRASFNRWVKDTKSEWANGIERTVRVYDVNGQLIEEYEGKFDIEQDGDKIRFDDAKTGKRHIIYFKTGTVIVDEK